MTSVSRPTAHYPGPYFRIKMLDIHFNFTDLQNSLIEAFQAPELKQQQLFNTIAQIVVNTYTRQDIDYTTSPLFTYFTTLFSTQIPFLQRFLNALSPELRTDLVTLLWHSALEEKATHVIAYPDKKDFIVCLLEQPCHEEVYCKVIDTLLHNNFGQDLIAILATQSNWSAYPFFGKMLITVLFNTKKVKNLCLAEKLPKLYVQNLLTNNLLLTIMLSQLLGHNRPQMLKFILNILQAMRVKETPSLVLIRQEICSQLFSLLPRCDLDSLDVLVQILTKFLELTDDEKLPLLLLQIIPIVSSTHHTKTFNKTRYSLMKCLFLLGQPGIRFLFSLLVVTYKMTTQAKFSSPWSAKFIDAMKQALNNPQVLHAAALSKTGLDLIDVLCRYKLSFIDDLPQKLLAPIPVSAQTTISILSIMYTTDSSHFIKLVEIFVTKGNMREMARYFMQETNMWQALDNKTTHSIEAETNFFARLLSETNFIEQVYAQTINAPPGTHPFQTAVNTIIGTIFIQHLLIRIATTKTPAQVLQFRQAIGI